MRHCRKLNPAQISEDVKDLFDELQLSVVGLVRGLDVKPGEGLAAVVLRLVPEIPEHGSVCPCLHPVEDKTVLVMVDHVCAVGEIHQFLKLQLREAVRAQVEELPRDDGRVQLFAHFRLPGPRSPLHGVSTSCLARRVALCQSPALASAPQLVITLTSLFGSRQVHRLPFPARLNAGAMLARCRLNAGAMPANWSMEFDTLSLSRPAKPVPRCVRRRRCL